MTEANDDCLYAEDRPYWATTVQPSKSLGELMACLAKFGIFKHEMTWATPTSEEADE